MSHTADRITDGLRYLAGEFSADKDDFRRDCQPHGAALLEACRNLGYAGYGQTPETRDRIALTPAGRRRLAAAEAPPGAEG